MAKDAPSGRDSSSGTPTERGADPLHRYRAKRDPGRTNEPFAERPVSAPGSTWAGRFVVHLHSATRRHFDLRIEIGGSLLSFAIPKGPTLDPKEKRLAVQTENHPLAYLEFEEIIPDGNYGAGPMIVWDTGGIRYLETSVEDGIARAKIDFELDGFKLRGRFGLIHTGARKKNAAGAPAPEWLIVKKPDAHAREGGEIVDELPRSVLSGLTVQELMQKADVVAEVTRQADAFGATALTRSMSELESEPPMVCALEGAPLRSPDWLYELKLDGVRIIASKSDHRATLRYRSGRVCSANYAEITRAVASLAPNEVVLDGEIVTFDERGRPNFSRIGPRIRARAPEDIRRARAEVPVLFLVFDILALEGRDLRGLPLWQRKEILASLLKGQGYIRALDHLEERGDALFALCEREELEGVLAKRKQSAYVAGPRVSGHWVKLKRALEDDFVVVGFSRGKGSRQSLGSLAVGTYRGDTLIYRGSVGSGLVPESIRLLEKDLAPLAVDEPQVSEIPDEDFPRFSWVVPELVVRARFSDFTDGGHLRAPVFTGFVADKSPRDCVAAPTAEREMLEQAAAEGEEKARPGGGLSLVRKPGLVLTNPDKIYWSEEGYTKGMLLRYYEAAAPQLLRFLRDRPIVLVRYPDGIDGKNFYQWRAPDGTPEWLRTLELYDEEKQEERGTGKAAFLVDDVDSLLYVINLGCIPIHVLAYREQTKRTCDFLTIDLDLGPCAFREAVLLALDLKQILDELGLVGFPKTSGQRGLHVLVPLGDAFGFEAAKILCELLGRILVQRHPEISTMERRKEHRGERVYVDTGQTGQSRTIVAPYSVRATRGAGVSTPLSWSEVHLALDPSVHTMETVPDRLATLGDVWSDFFQVRPDPQRLQANLANWTGRLKPPTH